MFYLVGMPYHIKDFNRVPSSASTFPGQRILTEALAFMVKALHYSIVWPFSSPITSFLECRGQYNRNHGDLLFWKAFCRDKGPIYIVTPMGSEAVASLSHSVNNRAQQRRIPITVISPCTQDSRWAHISAREHSATRAGGKIKSNWLKAIRKLEDLKQMGFWAGW